MTQTLLSSLTTAGVGGPAARYVEARTEAEIIAAVHPPAPPGERTRVLGGARASW